MIWHYSEMGFFRGEFHDHTTRRPKWGWLRKEHEMQYGAWSGMQDLSEPYETVTAAARADNMKGRKSNGSTQQLDARVDKLLLVCRSMWELVRDNTSLTEDDLMNKVLELDLRDGVADGKMQQGVQNCSHCGRAMSPRHARCLYCGREDVTNEAFDAAT
jgi:hypothetical protein